MVSELPARSVSPLVLRPSHPPLLPPSSYCPYRSRPTGAAPNIQGEGGEDGGDVRRRGSGSGQGGSEGREEGGEEGGEGRERRG
eukprot:253143-Hanusia_phi.AAC.1